MAGYLYRKDQSGQESETDEQHHEQGNKYRKSDVGNLNLREARPGQPHPKVRPPRPEPDPEGTSTLVVSDSPCSI